MLNYFKIAKFFLILPVLGVAIVTPSTLFPFIVGKYAWFRISVDLALIVFLLGYLFQTTEFKQIYGPRIKKLFTNPLTIAVVSFVIIFVLASLFAFSPKMAFWSNFERGEGGFQILHLGLFFILLAILFKEENDWRNIFRWALFGGFLMFIYGFFAAKGVSGFVAGAGHFGDPGFRFPGSIGNAAYVGTYSVFMLFYAAYLLFSKYFPRSSPPPLTCASPKASARRELRRASASSLRSSAFSYKRLLSFNALFLAAVFILFFGVFILAATRGAFVGLLAAILAFLGFFIYNYKKWRRLLIIAVCCLLLVVSSLVYFRDTPLVKSLPGSRIFELTVSAETWRARTIMWNIAWQGFKERPLLGWGPENYLYVFDRHFDTRYFEPDKGFGAWFDRAHSIYFDYLVETGILGLMAFLSIFISFYWLLLRKARITTDRKLITADKISVNQQNNQRKSVVIDALIFALPVAYLVQGIVLFDVWPTYINLFLFLAFAVYKFSKQETVTGKQ